MKRSQIKPNNNPAKKWTPRPKKCSYKPCSKLFTPDRQLQNVCSPACAHLKANAEKAAKQAKADRQVAKDRRETEKHERKLIRDRRERLKTRGEYIKDAQRYFNAYIRERDAGLPCICCGRLPAGGQSDMFYRPGGEWDAGHYRSRGSAPHLRFDERNVHAQLKHCNRYKSGNAVGYRIGLIERIGMAEVEALESDNTERRYTIADLKEIAKTYRQKKRDLIRQRGGESGQQV